MSEENSKPAEDQATAGQGSEAQKPNDKPQPHFGLQRLYLKDVSFEAPQGVKAFAQDWKPEVNQEMTTAVNKLDENNFECELTLTVTVKLADKVAFLVEVKQAGLFGVSGMGEQQTAHAMSTAAPEMLFPYAREVIDSVVTKGSFPALMLPPVNFNAMFAQAMQQQQQKAAAAQQSPESVQ
jgi:preprotein translocase subunit SecB